MRTKFGAVLLLMGVSFLATAQESAEVAGSALASARAAGEEGLAEIIVTAQKRSQSINDVGLTVTALGHDTLERQGIKTLDDLAKSIPGLTYAGTDFGTPVFTLRGVGFYDYSLGGYPTTSVYVDEVPLPFPVLTTHANLDLERIEVLKGPQGTLFGQNSTGGAINYIAAKPTETFKAGMDVTDGRFGQGDVDGYVSGPLTDTLRARLAVEHDFGGDWQRSFTRNDTLGQKNLDIGRLLLEWTPTSRLKVGLNLNAWHDRSDPQGGQYFATFPQIPLPGAIGPVLATYPFAPQDPRAADWGQIPRPSANKRQYQAALRADLNLTDDIVLTAISSYVDYQMQQVSDRDATTVLDFNQSSVGSIKSYTQELRVAGGEGTPLRWVLGGNYEDSKVSEVTINDNSESSVGTILGIKGGGISAANNVRTDAIFADSEYEVVPDITLKLGGRYTDARRSADLCTFDGGDGRSNAFVIAIARALNPGLTIPDLHIGDCTVLGPNNLPSRFLDTLQENNFSWRAGVDYKPTRDVLLYGNISKGYKAGSYPLVGTLSYVSYLPVVQESLLDYEGGFKAKLFDRKLGLNGAVFYYDYRDKQLLTKVIDPILGLIPALANIPKSRVEGAELELNAAPVAGLRLNAGLTYLDAVITKYTGVNAGGVAANFAGTSIPFTPKWQFVASADYDLPVSGNIRPFVGATLTERTGTSSIVGAATGAVVVPGYRSSVPIADTYNLPGYALLDLRAGIEAADGSWRLMLWGKNVTNKFYLQNVTSVNDVAVRYTGMPATYGITFSRTFGK